MSIIFRAVLDFFHEEDGTTAVEYAVMLALIIAVCIGSATVLAGATADSFNTSANAIVGAFAN
ncbi:MAG: Flp family type IVb pilin [Rubripirellula sp.]|jgi:pilus assembly protein Flp/PilA|nr:Flp family type IVb pilin [Rubripirellula sp.]